MPRRRHPAEPFPLKTMRSAARAVQVVDRRAGQVRKIVRSAGFPYRKPTIPGGVEIVKEPSKVGAEYDTAWARRPAARAARRVLARGPVRGLLELVASPEVHGLDRLDDLKALDDPPALIFVANHQSHLDAPLLSALVPDPWRKKLIVAAAADYFFPNRVAGAAAALTLNAIPIDRQAINRKSAEQAARLVREGWSLVIFPEGGRSPDGWAQNFKGGAAFLAERTGAMVVPVHIDGAGQIFGKGMKRPKPGRTIVTFGSPLRQLDTENVRRFNERIETAVAELADEALTDWWTARKHAASGDTPTLTGPAYTGWRRSWELSARRARGRAGQRRRQKRRWPNLSGD